jgi:chromosomal replication initiation ATPase DnaA
MNNDPANKQLPLALPHRPALSREDFLVTPGNAEAIAWLDCWPHWPGHALALHGPRGCGKTHLAHVFAARSGAAIVRAAELPDEDIPYLLDHHRALVVENMDSLLPDPEVEEALFHAWNLVKDATRHILLTGEEPPARWKVGLPDLRSRLSTAQTAAIAAPDDILMEAVLVKLFIDRQLRVGPDVIGFLLRHMERSFAAARRVVAAADTMSLAERRHITVRFIAKVLDAQNRDGSTKP